MSLKIAIVGTGGVARNGYLPRLVAHEDVECFGGPADAILEKLPELLDQ